MTFLIFSNLIQSTARDSGVAMWGEGVRTFGKCDVIFSYIYTNNTILVLHLVRLN